MLFPSCYLQYKTLLRHFGWFCPLILKRDGFGGAEQYFLVKNGTCGTQRAPPLRRPPCRLGRPDQNGSAKTPSLVRIRVLLSLQGARVLKASFGPLGCVFSAHVWTCSTCFFILMISMFSICRLFDAACLLWVFFRQSVCHGRLVLLLRMNVWGSVGLVQQCVLSGQSTREHKQLSQHFCKPTTFDARTCEHFS